MQRFAVLLAVLLAAACGREQAAPADAHATSRPADEIAWFHGSVDEAFAYAKEHGKPIFLYWGAAWCPPCHEIKATVFRSREFIDRSRLFVPVYLDGDTANAQALGEKFGVVGYPTMLVFSPEGEEITRIPGGIDIQAYANVLDLTLASTQPVSKLLAQVLDDGARLTAGQCRLMAYCSWDQNETVLAGRDAQAAFSALADACPVDSTVERSILRMAALETAVDTAADKNQPVALAAGQSAEALALVNMVLDDDRMVRANLYTVLTAGARITRAITGSGSAQRAQLQARFLAVLDRLKDDPTLFTTERLYTALGKIRFERIDAPEKPLSTGLQDEIRAMVANADEQTRDVYERQTVINAAANVLDEAGMKQQARQLLLAELDISKQPYYFMVDLADIEQQEGNYPAAIDWLKRAYDDATGPATRFQWGTYYVNGLIEMTPDDIARIQAETVSVVRELERGGGFYQRPKAQLKRLETKLTDWATNPDRKAGLGRIRQDILGICGTIPRKEPARATCEAFLAPA
jgi:thiol-disulfide isomerase/thioredoxin